MRKTMMQFGAAIAAMALTATLGLGSCAMDDGSFASDGGGSQGGSMARFTISGDWLYTVDHTYLSVVSVADPAYPVKADHLWVGSDIETIFTMDTLLFVGSQSAMTIFDISKPEFPEELSVTTHFKSCDPVVAADTLAFVTLNSSLGTWCGRSGDVLIVFDISDLHHPVIIDELPLSSPRGLAVDMENKMLFVCDNGIKAFDISDPRDVEVLYSAASTPEVGRIDAYDCILMDGRLLVIGADGLYQLGYDEEEFSLISKIEIARNRR